MMQAPARSIPDVALDGEGRIGEDIACRRCGYNLRGLPPDGCCPECELPVWSTAHGDLLRFQDPAWLRRLARGALVLLILVLVVVLGFTPAAFAMAMLGDGVTPPLVGFVMFASIGIGQVCAVWLITTPEPGADRPAPPVDVRTFARWGTIATVVAGFIVMPLGGWGAVQWPPGSLTAWEIAVELLGGAIDLVHTAATAALMIYGRRLALRLPDDRLARRTLIVTWGLVAPTAFFKVQETAFRAGVMFDSEVLGMVYYFVVIVASVALLVFFVLAVFLLVSYVRRLRTVLAQAEVPAVTAAP